MCFLYASWRCMLDFSKNYCATSSGFQKLFWTSTLWSNKWNFNVYNSGSHWIPDIIFISSTNFCIHYLKFVNLGTLENPFHLNSLRFLSDPSALHALQSSANDKFERSYEEIHQDREPWRLEQRSSSLPVFLALRAGTQHLQLTWPISFIKPTLRSSLSCSCQAKRKLFHRRSTALLAAVNDHANLQHPPLIVNIVFGHT